MHYISTRGGIEPIGFAQAVMMGLATDGGLLVPAEIPVLEPARLRAWADLSFQDLALEVSTLFIGEEIPRADLKALIDRSYATFSHPEVTPVAAAGETPSAPGIAVKALENVADLTAWAAAQNRGLRRIA